MTDIAQALAVGATPDSDTDPFNLGTQTAAPEVLSPSDNLSLTEARFSLPRSHIGPPIGDTEMAVEQLVRDIVDGRF